MSQEPLLCLIRNLCGLLDLSTLTISFSTNFWSSTLTKLGCSPIALAMPLTVLFPFSICPSRVASIIFRSAVFLRAFSMGASMPYFALRSCRFWDSASS